MLPHLFEIKNDYYIPVASSLTEFVFEKTSMAARYDGGDLVRYDGKQWWWLDWDEDEKFNPFFYQFVITDHDGAYGWRPVNKPNLWQTIKARAIFGPYWSYEHKDIDFVMPKKMQRNLPPGIYELVDDGFGKYIREPFYTQLGQVQALNLHMLAPEQAYDALRTFLLPMPFAGVVLKVDDRVAVVMRDKFLPEIANEN